MDSVSYSDSCEVSKESWRESFHKLSDVNSTPEEKMCSQFLVSVSDSSFILSRTGLTPNPSWLSTLRLAEENIHECVCGHMSACVCVCVCVCALHAQLHNRVDRDSALHKATPICGPVHWSVFWMVSENLGV